MNLKLSALAVVMFSVRAALSQVFNVSVSFDQVYDMADQSTNIVSCSEDLIASDFKTFGALPRFPFIGGSFNVTGFDAPGCGTCWELAFRQATIRVLAIDHAGPGTFNIALEAMNALTNNQAEFFGRVNATAVEVDLGECGVASIKKHGDPKPSGRVASSL